MKLVVYQPLRPKNLAFDFGRNKFTLSQFVGYADLTDIREILPKLLEIMANENVLGNLYI